MESDDKKGDRWLRLGDLAAYEVIDASLPDCRSAEPAQPAGRQIMHCGNDLQLSRLMQPDITSLVIASYACPICPKLALPANDRYQMQTSPLERGR